MRQFLTPKRLGKAVLPIGAVFYLVYRNYPDYQSAYPREVRAPLKYALTLKNRKSLTEPEVESALIAFNESIEKARQLIAQDDHDRIIRLGIMVEAARFALKHGRTRKAMEYLESALFQYLNIHPPLLENLSVQREQRFSTKELKWLAGVSVELADVYVEMMHFDKAETTLNWIIATIITLGLNEKGANVEMGAIVSSVGPCIDRLSELLRRQKRYDDSTLVELGLLRLLEHDPRLPCRRANAMNTVSSNLYEMGRVSEAKSWNEEGKKVLKEISNWQLLFFSRTEKAFCRECQQAILINDKRLNES